MYKPSTSKYTITFESFENRDVLATDSYFNTLEEAIIFARGFQEGFYMDPSDFEGNGQFYIENQTTGEIEFPEVWKKSLEGKNLLFRKALIQIICTYKHNDEELAEEIKAFCEDFIMDQIRKRKTEKK